MFSPRFGVLGLTSFRWAGAFFNKGGFMRTALFLMSLLLIGGCASGTSMVTGARRDPISPESVRVYSEPPAQFEVIALLKAEAQFGWSDQGKQDQAIEYLKAKAAEIGANGLLVIGTGESTKDASFYSNGYGGGTLSQGRTSQKVSAKVIYVTREK